MKENIYAMEQMEGWASEYSVPVRRWMRWLGKNIFDDDEPKENYLFFLLGLASLLCLGIYHNRVMQMDKTNRIFYKTVIQTRRDAEIWQDIDSIVKGIKLQRESYADPPKKE